MWILFTCASNFTYARNNFTCARDTFRRHLGSLSLPYQTLAVRGRHIGAGYFICTEAAY